MVKFSKTLITLLLSGFRSVCSSFRWHPHLLLRESSKQADEGAGRTYRMVVNHGFVRYGSEREFRTFRAVEGSFPIPCFMFLAAVALGLRYDHFQIRRGSTP